MPDFFTVTVSQEMCIRDRFYIVHHNEKIGTDEDGWGVEDQLLKQLAKADELDNYSGSAVSYTHLHNQPRLQSTEEEYRC